MKKIIVASILSLLVLPGIAWAKIGVGVATGKIMVDQPLKSGLIYTLPPLTVLNTGDEPADYEVTIAYREGQTELRPSKDWLSFEPAEFTLNPGKAQVVKIKLTLPVQGAAPGNYFAFLQAHPTTRMTGAGTSIGIAAAAKLYFSVQPTNFFVGIYYRIASLYSMSYPWSFIVILIIVLAVLIVLFRKYFSLNIGINVRRK